MMQEFTYFDWQNRLAPVVTALRQSGVWFFPHPWLNVFLPGSAVVAYVRDVLADLTVTETDNSQILCYPFRRSKLLQRFVQTPDEEICSLFGLLRTAPPNDLTAVDAQVAANRALFEQAWALGGTHYPIGALPFSPADWPHFLRLKARYDPRQVLTPGQGIFPA